jgi:hypothetical protein
MLPSRAPPFVGTWASTWEHRTKYNGTGGHYANNYPGSSLSKQEHTVINIGDPDGVPRLVSCPRSRETPAIVSRLTNVMTTRLLASDHHKVSIGIQVCSNILLLQRDIYLTPLPRNIPSLLRRMRLRITRTKARPRPRDNAERRGDQGHVPTISNHLIETVEG